MQNNKRSMWLCKAKDNLPMDINFAFKSNILLSTWSESSDPLKEYQRMNAHPSCHYHIRSCPPPWQADTFTRWALCGSITSCDSIRGLHSLKSSFHTRVHLSHSKERHFSAQCKARNSVVRCWSVKDAALHLSSVSQSATPKAIVKWHIQTVAVSRTAGSTLSHHQDNTHSGRQV